jgi:hypothetical protein
MESYDIDHQINLLNKIVEEVLGNNFLTKTKNISVIKLICFELVLYISEEISNQ